MRREAAGKGATPGTASTGKPISPPQGLIPALQQGAWARNAWLRQGANPKELLEDILDLYRLPSEKGDGPHSLDFLAKEQFWSSHASYLKQIVLVSVKLLENLEQIQHQECTRKALQAPTTGLK